MKILYVAMKYDYGDPKRGLSFEHTNFYDTLSHMRHKVAHFDFMSEMQKHGQEAMNERLYKTYQKEKPDLMFFFLFTDEIYKETIRKVTDEGRTVTFNWFADDHWRFDSYSRYWAPLFHYVSTTASSALPRYKKIGYQNVIKTQWGCNHFMYKKLNLPLKYDVAFVGQPHGDRRQVIERIRQVGVDVCAWGYGWEDGRMSQEEMIKIFNQSRINLNLSNSLTVGRIVQLKSAVKNVAKSVLGRGSRLDLIKVSISDTLQFLSGESGSRQQIKGRNFEIPGCSGFQLSGEADNLGEYFVPDREIVIFKDMPDLIDKVKYYLLHGKERVKIAKAGYERTLAEHTYEKRFNEILGKMSLVR